MYMAHHFGENSLLCQQVCDFLDDQRASLTLVRLLTQWKEKAPHFTQSHVHVVLSGLNMGKKALIYLPTLFTQCLKSPVGFSWEILLLPIDVPLLSLLESQVRMLSTSASMPAWAALQILYIEWMMVIIVKGLGYYLFLSSRQHLTVFVYQVVIKILCLDVKLTYFITNLLLQLIMNYV